MAPVWFSDTRQPGRLVDMKEFVDQVVTRYKGVTGRADVQRVVIAVTQWLRDMVVEAGRQREDPVMFIRAANRHGLLPNGVDAIAASDPRLRPMARFVWDSVCETTVRELPFWGCDRIRRANRLFSEKYPSDGAQRKRRRVSFGSVTIRQLDP